MSDAVKKIEDVAEGARVAPASSRGLRAAEVKPASLNEDGTFEFVLATPEPVIRWYRDLDSYERFQASEVLPVETAILMSESGRSIPILDSHQSWSVDHVIGVVTEMRVEGNAIVCRGRLSGRDSVKDIIEGVREGVLRNFSVGYDILETELVTDTVTGARTMRARRWLILEASLVPVPADGNAQIRSAGDLVVDWRRSNETKESEMTEAEIKAIVDAAVAEGVRAALAANTETAEAKAAREATELAARNAPKAGERSAEETAQVTLLRSQATSYGVEAAFDVMASTGASVAELRGVLLQGMRSKAHPGEIEGFSGGDTKQSPSGDEPLMRFADTATAKAEAASARR